MPQFAHVIPVMRTPLGIEGFDYRIPAEQTIAQGDMVTIPFRRGKSVGLVAKISSHSAFAAQALPIEGVWNGLHFNPLFIDLLSSTAARTFSSCPTVLKSWLRTLPKRPTPTSFVPAQKKDHGLQGDWQIGPLKELHKRANEYSKTKRVLIVTPWVIRAEQLKEMLPEAHLLHSDLADGEAFRAWTSFLSKKEGCLITTKIGAWLAVESDIVLLDEPEQDDHKQDELAPRYDARKVLLFCAQNGQVRVESMGLTPPLHSQAKAPTLSGDTTLHIHHPQGRSVIPLIQADTIDALTNHEGPRVIIHAIRGSLARLVCRDCQWEATCPACGSGLGADKQGAICRRCRKHYPMPGTCPVCQGIDLSRSLPGIERLQTQWQKSYPELEVDWRDTTAKELEKPFLEHSLVVVTEAGFLATGEDIRRRERQCIAIRRLADRVQVVKGTLILQCREDLAPFIREWMTQEGMEQFTQREREERRTFQYPPATRVVKIMIKGTEANAENWKTATQRQLKTTPLRSAAWRGPFPAEYQPASRGARQILHLVLPPEIPESDLINSLTPCLQGATIDLDPIAFLR